MPETPSAQYSAGQVVDGFTVRKVTPLENLRAVAYELEHRRSGARILHLHTNDAENLFSVTFPTPPPDDTGVPHILEHAVLAGSRRFPVKDPFFEMLKSSMATFINAMTGTDYTVYPVSSNVRQDFYNLAEVYWDAVFYANLTERTFQREGHHLELAKKGDLSSDLIIKGIVYNEMKGARSSPDSKVSDLIEKNLWPDTPYGKDSGGDPDHIPELTYDNFKRFHQNYYHPSNGYFFLYGDIPTLDHLRFLGPKLDAFERRDIKPNIPPQPRWSEPHHVSDRYPVAPTDPVTGKTYVNVNWLVGRTTDVPHVMAFSALERILLGNQGAPLRKALIDSKLGEDVTHSGYWTNGLETSFHVGLKGSEADRTDAFVELVTRTLATIADEGVPQRLVDAAFQQLAYRFLEIQTHFPLHLMGRAAENWLHGGDPLDMLRAEQHLADLKARYAADPQLFSKLIREKLLNNAHRLTLTVSPDRELQAKKEAQFSERMRQKKASLPKQELERIAAVQAELDALIDQPNPPEALATLPQLKVKDLPAKPRHIPTSVEPIDGGGEILRNDVFANGVNYLQVSFDLTGLPPDLYPYLALYADAVHKMGAAAYDYVRMAERVASNTGGVGFGAAFTTRVDDPVGTVRRATFTTKFLDGKAEDALGVLRDFLFEVNPRDVGRLKDVLLQARAHHRGRPANAGMGIALHHAARGYGREPFLDDLLQGLPQTRLIEALNDGDPDALIGKLEAVRAFLTTRGKPTASFTGSDDVYPVVRRTLSDWSKQMGAGSTSAASDVRPVPAPCRSGLAAPMNVAYCTMVLPAPHTSDPRTPVLAVGARMLGMGYVLDEVRFKGTAYGGGCGINPAYRTFTFHSYRDPWVNRTLDVFRGALDHVRKSEWTQADVDRAIIGSAKEGERPIRPGEATSQALWRHLIGDTRERREARHAAILGATVSGVKGALTDVLERGFPQATVAVVSSREKLENANRERPESPLEIEEILPKG